MVKERLLEVKGYYQEGNNFNFVEEKSWKGKVILREDLTFEGVVADKCSKHTDNILISGTLVEYNGASLIKFTNHGYRPCSFFGMSTGKEIIGGWAVHDFRFTKDMGRCKIIFAEVPMDKNEMSEILQKIEDFKSGMDGFSTKIYNSLVANMQLTVKQFIDNMNENRENIEKEIGFPLQKLEL